MTAFDRVKAALGLFPDLPHGQIDKIARVSRGYANRVWHKLTGAKPQPAKSAAGRAGNESRRLRKAADRPQNSGREAAEPLAFVGSWSVEVALPVSPMPPVMTFASV